MAGQNNMSEHAAVHNESQLETFFSSLKDRFNFLQLSTFLANTS